MRSKLYTANSNYRSAAAFPLSYTVAVKYVRVAARRILNLWWQRTGGCRTTFEVTTHGGLKAALGRPWNSCGPPQLVWVLKKSILIHKTLGQSHRKRKATVHPTYSRRGTALRHGWGLSNCYDEPRNEKKYIILRYFPGRCRCKYLSISEAYGRRILAVEQMWSRHNKQLAEVMPRLHLPRAPYDKLVFNFSCNFSGIAGVYGLRCLCLHYLWIRAGHGLRASVIHALLSYVFTAAADTWWCLDYIWPAITVQEMARCS